MLVQNNPEIFVHSRNNAAAGEGILRSAEGSSARQTVEGGGGVCWVLNCTIKSRRSGRFGGRQTLRKHLALDSRVACALCLCMSSVSFHHVYQSLRTLLMRCLYSCDPFTTRWRRFMISRTKNAKANIPMSTTIIQQYT